MAQRSPEAAAAARPKPPSPPRSLAPGSRAALGAEEVRSSIGNRSELPSSHTSTKPSTAESIPLIRDNSTESPSDRGKEETSDQTSLGKLDIPVPQSGGSRSNSYTGPQSVVHAPQNFKQFTETSTKPPMSLDIHRSTSTSSSSPSVTSTTRRRPGSETPKASEEKADVKDRSTLPLNTDLPSVQAYSRERDTPLAQTVQDAVDEQRRSSRSSSGSGAVSGSQNGKRSTQNKTNLQVHSPGQSHTALSVPAKEQRFKQLEDSLDQSWTLCNTLANFSGILKIQDQAWHSCWRICQILYDTRTKGYPCHVVRLLDLFRDLCHALYDSRQKSGEPADSVLRVLYELQNHLYGTHDENLPTAFQERTLDFYVTLCHRLIKQQSSQIIGTEHLLRACWSLVEALIGLRQNSIGGTREDEELLDSAVQSCLELCGLFKQGWTPGRSDRATPRVSQMTFASVQASGKGSYLGKSPPELSRSSSFARSQVESYDMPNHIPPETPTTIFDDNPMDALDEHHNTPNILVLGTKTSSAASNHRWSSSSNYTESSQLTSPTATPKTEEPNRLVGIRALLVKSAMYAGFRPRSPSSSASSSKTDTRTNDTEALLVFLRSMPPDSFGSQPWQLALVDKYRKLAFAWPSITSSLGGSGSGRGGTSETLSLAPQREAESSISPADVAAAVQWMMKIGQYAWLEDLFRVVFGQSLEEEDDEDDDDDDGTDDEGGSLPT